MLHNICIFVSESQDEDIILLLKQFFWATNSIPDKADFTINFSHTGEEQAQPSVSINDFLFYINLLLGH